jgi:2-amino-4-hydroxy-6-hydroxymethyldihydropteridine diphosphokinase
MASSSDAEAMEPRPVFLGLGSNQGDRYGQLLAAMELLESEVGNLVHSSVYESPPWGVVDQPSFLNCCCRGHWQGAPGTLLRRVKAIEERLGRRPTRRWGERLIDIDILILGEEVVNTPELKIPHPQLGRRRFVCEPLADLCPQLAVPGLEKTVTELAASLEGIEPLELFRARARVAADRSRGKGPA